jgi:hypothetical protein
LDKNTSGFLIAMLKIEENINLLEEYKKSLIHLWLRQGKYMRWMNDC